jgi:hypothetical protein
MALRRSVAFVAAQGAEWPSSVPWWPIIAGAFLAGLLVGNPAKSKNYSIFSIVGGGERDRLLNTLGRHRSPRLIIGVAADDGENTPTSP